MNMRCLVNLTISLLALYRNGRKNRQVVRPRPEEAASSNWTCAAVLAKITISLSVKFALSIKNQIQRDAA